jgi:vacuolar iron transporter family protein
MDQQTLEKILTAQENEITEYHVYKNLAEIVKVKEQSEILNQISLDELRHYGFFKGLSGKEVLPDKFKIFIYVSIARILGLNFGLRLMENGEGMAQDAYAGLKDVSPDIEQINSDEEKHERALLDMIDEDRLKYVSSIVLGLNDALVELTATLAGFTLALQNTRLIGIVGLITGIAAAMSMAASEYLATKGEQTRKDPIKASVYTGISYIATVILLVLPYFLLRNVFVSLGLAIGCSLLIILIFTFYVSVAKGLDFKKRFSEMAVLSLSIAAVTFFIGMAIKKIFGVNI